MMMTLGHLVNAREWKKPMLAVPPLSYRPRDQLFLAQWIAEVSHRKADCLRPLVFLAMMICLLSLIPPVRKVLTV